MNLSDADLRRSRARAGRIVAGPTTNAVDRVWAMGVVDALDHVLGDATPETMEACLGYVETMGSRLQLVPDEQCGMPVVGDERSSLPCQLAAGHAGPHRWGF